MQAMVCSAYGAPDTLVLEERPMPVPHSGQVRVRIASAGVNFVDALLIAGTYQVKIPPPFVPGNELAGTVDALGADVTGFAVGERVMAQTGTGAFAEYACVPVAQLRRVPEPFSFAEAATFQLTYATALYALRERGQLRSGDTLLVLGAAGGVGTAAIDIGKALGARVIAAAGSDAKLERCRALGADALINYEREDLKECAKALTAGRGADVNYDPVGGRYSEAALRAIAWEGRFLVIGFAAGQIAKIPLNLALLKGCQIGGVDWGQLARTRPAATLPVWQTLTAIAQAGRLHRLIHAHYALADTARALHDVSPAKA